MPGLGDLIGAKVRILINDAGENSGKIVKTITELVGEKAQSVIDDNVGSKIDRLLEKAGIQKQLDGKILIKFPWMKSAEERTAEVLSIHPEWGKICAHVFDDSVRNETGFYDLDGNEWYKIKGSWNNARHMALLRDNQVIGKVDKEIILIKNPISLANPYRYKITLREKELGTIEIRDRKFKAYCIPDFDSWVMNETKYKEFEVLDESGNTVAAVYYTGENDYLFDYSTSFNPELLILTYIATQMRKEDISYSNKTLSDKMKEREEYKRRK